MRKKVVIVGAAGYVGIELVTQLETLGEYELFAFTRENGSFLLDGKKVTMLREQDIKPSDQYDVVVNLAYPTVPSAVLFPSVNKSILNSVKKLVSDQTKIIHVSTQAVFGFGMDKPVRPDFLQDRRDFPYIEAKLAMENLMKKTFPSNNLSIVRLGNVWGPGAGTWTGALADKLLFGQYVAVEGKDGYSNITDVKNVASYLVHLIKDTSVTGTNIYHLSEFSSIKWSEIISLMSRELNVEPVYTQLDPEYALKLKNDVSKVLKFPSVGNIYRELVWGRFSGSYLRGLVRVLSIERFNKIKKVEKIGLPQTQSLNRSELTHLIVTSSDKEFKSVLEKNWKPMINFEQSWQYVKEWMQEVGYIS